MNNGGKEFKNTQIKKRDLLKEDDYKGIWGKEPGHHGKLTNSEGKRGARWRK